jgi:GTP-binding protein YchF
MALQCGIVGLPNVGKSTHFNCLSNAKAQAANFPFCTIEPNVGVITVPDERMNKLSELVKPERIVPTNIEIVDIAGLVKGASKGEGLGNKFLANIRETNAIIHVLRCFEDSNIVHVDGNVNPIRDKETIDFELILKDIESIEKKMQRVEKMAKVGTDKDAKKCFDVLTVYKDHLEAGNSARNAPVSEEDQKYIADIFLLTAKPVMYVCNVDTDCIKTGNKHVDAVKEVAAKEGATVLIITAAMEAEIAAMENYDDIKIGDVFYTNNKVIKYSDLSDHGSILQISFSNEKNILLLIDAFLENNKQLFLKFHYVNEKQTIIVPATKIHYLLEKNYLKLLTLQKQLILDLLLIIYFELFLSR